MVIIFYGLPGLLASIGLAGSSSGIEIAYGPAPLKILLMLVYTTVQADWPTL